MITVYSIKDGYRICCIFNDCCLTIGHTIPKQIQQIYLANLKYFKIDNDRINLKEIHRTYK